MNPRTTGLLFLVALGLGVFIYVYEVSDPDPEAQDTGTSMLFPGLVADEVEWLTLTSEDGVRVEVERENGVWRGVIPRPFAMDQTTLDGIASQLAQLEIEGRVVDPPGAGEAPSVDLADFGLGSAFNELHFRSRGSRYGLRIGRRTPVGSNTYVTRIDADAEKVVYVSTWRANALRKPWLELRDRRVLDFDHTAVTRVDARWPGGRVSVSKQGDGWRIREPLEEAADRETVETLLSDLAFLQADGFIDDPDPAADYGLDPPSFGVELEGGQGLGDGSAFVRSLRIGGSHEGKRVAERDGGQLYLLAPERLEELPRSLLAYRYKRLARFEIADVRRFTLAYADRPGVAPGAGGSADAEALAIEGALQSGSWVTEPERMAPARVGVLLARLASLEASDIVADGLGTSERGALGLAPHALVVRVFGESDALLAQVGFGDRDPERGVFADRMDDGIVYRAAPEIIDWLPLTTGALRAEFLEGEPEEGDAPPVHEWAEGEDMPLASPDEAAP